MRDYTKQNKAAWEYNAYEFWIKESGFPEARAAKIIANPIAALKRYSQYFDTYKDLRIANICGSCGKKAVPLAVLGAQVTVFDLSEDNRRYALELAQAANTEIQYEVCDVLEINMDAYAGYFDVIFMEGGVLHYFHNINQFMDIMHRLLKPGGKMICSDFHPFTKITDALCLDQPATGYFSTAVFEGEMAHARFFEEPVRSRMPKCSYRKYTISEIINSVISSGLQLVKFDEHPAWANPELPGEFTLVAFRPSTKTHI
ncbi:MAG: class I SAM-dependent methyltransferase [Peptococcaceae bacterium]|nr:class I SAM-dependent methyltransferase [Peptococcaceae bacterium]